MILEHYQLVVSFSVLHLFCSCGFIFFFKQKTAYEMQRGLVGSEMCIRDRRRVHGAPCEIQEDYSLESLDIQSSSQESLKSSSGYFQALDLSASLPEENSSSFEVEPMDFPYGPQVKLKIARPEKDLQY
eukprot:TRINITY_DN53897_c0_g1_i1.p2 TRINITY_DN53897_c0_g1~~TRINITY_DN53897_c0_g1_i1.p2  ORF type:complete len:129 (-),score=26.92 TRINITY_DN53897_c0_g1_i1:169-555(-)